MELQQLLANCQNPDQNVRSAAEEALSVAGQQDMGGLLHALINELANETQQEIIRQQAGMYVKLQLSAGDDAIKAVKLQQWEAIRPEVKTGIKAGVLQTLHSQSSNSAKHTAALIIGKMGAIELPKNGWPEMLQTLLTNVTGPYNDGTKVASLEALGYMCDEWEREDMDQAQINQILTCIVDGMRSDRPPPIRLAATKALLNGLDFTHSNFETASERDMLMRVICDNTLCPDAGVRKTAFECICQIASLYYSKLKPYMHVLFEITMKAIKEEENEVALQALEFWSTLCDEEADIKEEIRYALEAEEEPPERTCEEYVKLALPHLIPLLLQCLQKQDEDADDDDWGIAEAGGTCLALTAQVVGDEVVDSVVPFITANIQHENWRNREAAVMAFGSVLDGPSEEKLAPLVASAMPILVQAMRDSHVSVVDTATWTVGRICELHVTSIPNEVVPALVQNLVVLLGMQARVCNRACFALHSFGEAFSNSRDQPTNHLSSFFSMVIEKLLGVLDRKDANIDHNTMMQATEAMNVLIGNSAFDVRPIVLQTLQFVLKILEGTFTQQVLSNDDKEKQQGMQSLMCGTIQVICQKVKKDVLPFSTKIMELLVQMFKNKHALAQEEAFMAVGALADPLEGEFEKFMPHFIDILIQGLSDYEEYQVCSAAVGVVGDLCRALEKKMAAYADTIVRCLLQNLQNPTINRNVKPPVLACIGDVALALSGGFDKYVDVTMAMLQQAQGVCSVVSKDMDEDMIEYVNQLRVGILEAYSGILQGLNESNKATVLQPYVQGVLSFLEALAQCEERDEAVLQKAIAVIGDIGHSFGASAAPAMKQNTFVRKLISDGLTNAEEDSTKETAVWAQNMIMG